MGYPKSRVDALLADICIKRGWCIRPEDFERVRRAAAHGIDAVTDAIINAELDDPLQCDRSTRRWLREQVDDWLFDPYGRGASSAKPL